MSEAASGRTGRAIRAMQLEAEVSANPEMRADRFVAQWRSLRAEHARLGGYEHEKARGALETRMKGLARSVDKDPALGEALGRRAKDLGLGRHWSPEWRLGGPADGGIGTDMAGRMRRPSISHQLVQSLGLGRGLGR
jgi:hypothetical protein